MSYSFISPKGEIVRTETVKEFAQKYGFRESNARSLACGHFQTLHGWCSTHKSARSRRKRFMTEIVDTKTDERMIIGPSLRAFARQRGLCESELYKLVNGRQVAYCNLILGETADNLAQCVVAEAFS